MNGEVFTRNVAFGLAYLHPHGTHLPLYPLYDSLRGSCTLHKD
jgi:hypothetical protein